MLQQALAMSLEAGAAAPSAAAAPALAASLVPDFATMTEEEQIAYAMQISMQDCGKTLNGCSVGGLHYLSTTMSILILGYVFFT